MGGRRTRKEFSSSCLLRSVEEMVLSLTLSDYCSWKDGETFVGDFRGVNFSCILMLEHNYSPVTTGDKSFGSWYIYRRAATRR